MIIIRVRLSYSVQQLCHILLCDRVEYGYFFPEIRIIRSTAVLVIIHSYH